MLKKLLLIAIGWLLAVPCPAGINIIWDYTYDTAGFFSGANISRRILLDDAAGVFESALATDHFTAIAPGGTNTWNLQFNNPSTGSTVTLANPQVAADTLRVYVGARSFGGSELGQAEFAYNASGSAAWINSFNAKNTTTHYEPVGGSITFDSLAAWYFDPDPSTLESFTGKYDFYSVVQHELGHLFGFSSGSKAFAADTSAGNQFTGTHADALFGGPISLSSDSSHWADGLLFHGAQPAMDPALPPNLRTNFAQLDFAALTDIGYIVTPEPTVLIYLLSGAAWLSRRRRASPL